MSYKATKKIHTHHSSLITITVTYITITITILSISIIIYYLLLLVIVIVDSRLVAGYYDSSYSYH